MTHDELLQRIRIDPEICSGKPCIRGHRIWVSLILDFLASGTTIQELLADYPQLEEADVLACIAYGQATKDERNLGLEILEGIREIKRGQIGRVANVPDADQTTEDGLRDSRGERRMPSDVART